MNWGLFFYSLFNDMMQRFIDRGSALIKLQDLRAAQLLRRRELVADFGLSYLWQYYKPALH